MNKKSDWNLIVIWLKFKVVIKEDHNDGGFNVSCPALPGCHSQGETIDEALENIKEAITGVLEVLNEKVVAVDAKDKILEVVV